MNKKLALAAMLVLFAFPWGAQAHDFGGWNFWGWYPGTGSGGHGTVSAPEMTRLRLACRWCMRLEPATSSCGAVTRAPSNRDVLCTMLHSGNAVRAGWARARTFLRAAGGQGNPPLHRRLGLAI